MPIVVRADDRDLLDAYSRWQEGRSFSPHTIKRRRVSLGLLAASVYPLGLADVTHGDIEDWLRSKRAARTRHAYRSDAASFYTWACRRKLVAVNPVELVDPVKVPKSLPRPIDPAQVAVIIGTAEAREADVALMVALGAYAGLRVSEIAALTSADLMLHASPPVLVIRSGKGRKDRTVPLHPALERRLRAGRRPDGPLFGVTARGVSRRIADVLDLCGLDATPHQLRHTFGTELARVSRGNMRLVASLMGHDSMTTTAGYVALSGNGYDAIAAMFDGEAAAG